MAISKDIYIRVFTIVLVLTVLGLVNKHWVDENKPKPPLPPSVVRKKRTIRFFRQSHLPSVPTYSDDIFQELKK